VKKSAPSLQIRNPLVVGVVEFVVTPTQ
jgi:hypothetical protein